jgi:hypothetical protein
MRGCRVVSYKGVLEPREPRDGRYEQGTSLLSPLLSSSTDEKAQVYGFEGETKKKYSELTYKLFEEVFTCRTPLPSYLVRSLTCMNVVPLATLITASRPPLENAAPNPKNPTLFQGVKRFFVVHGSSSHFLSPLSTPTDARLTGGLFSRENVLLSEIKSIDRMKQKQPGHDGLMCEMLWTDPQDAQGRGPSKRVSLPSHSRRAVLMSRIVGSRNWIRTGYYEGLDGEEFCYGCYSIS